MSDALSGRVALVTGGSKGIGLAIARALAEEGARVAITARGEDALRRAAAALRPFEVLTVAANAIEQRAVDDAVEKVVQSCGAIDILVNNVGGAGKFGGFADLDDGDWRNAFDLNVLSAVHYVRAADAHLRKSKNARIVNISSIAAVQPGTFNPHYTVTKAAIVNLTKYLANYFVKSGILVNAVCPGPVHSESWDENIRRLAVERAIPVEVAREQVEREEAEKIPLGRVGDGEDVAGLVAFLASDRASWITGSCFHVNGGKLATV